MDTRQLIEDKEELARLILMAAIEKVSNLGFMILVGNRTGQRMKIPLNKESIHLYHRDKH